MVDKVELKNTQVDKVERVEWLSDKITSVKKGQIFKLKEMETFDKIGRAITSMGAVIFVLIMVVIAMVFFSHTLFTQALPETMATWEKMAAAWFLALGWELTVLVTTCNTKHLNRRIPSVMAICSGIILLFFVQAFDTTQPLLVICQRWFVGILIAAINFIYADLFYSKWIERLALIDEPMKLNDLESKVIQLRVALDQAHSKQKLFDELYRFKEQITNELTCPHCKAPQKSFGTLHAHKGHCPLNPRKTEMFKALAS